LYPPSEPPFLVVTALQPGASPEAVVEGLARPIEEALQASAGVRHVDSTSREGRVVVSAEYDLGVDLGERQRAVQERLAAATLPAGVATPSVERVAPDSLPIYTMAVSGPDLVAAERYVDSTLRPRLARLAGVAGVTRTGGTNPVVTVVADPVRLRQTGYTAADVAAAVSGANVSVPAGGVSAEGSELPVQVTATTSSVEELRSLPLEPRPGAKPVKVGEVATVEADEIGTGATISRADGQPAVTLEVRRERSATTVSVVDRIHRALDQRPAPPGVKLVEVMNQAAPVRESLRPRPGRRAGGPSRHRRRPPVPPQRSPDTGGSRLHPALPPGRPAGDEGRPRQPEPAHLGLSEGARSRPAWQRS
jgi:HAE1 family hydrophobic/amphiphilic exporter-1